MWNKQRKDEVLLDVEDIALGHTTRLRWNPEDQWVFSEAMVHPAIIDMQTFKRAQQRFAEAPRPNKPRQRHSKRCYPLKGAMWCGLCERKMQAHHNGTATYYRCRFPEEYGLANKITHPRNVYVREDHLLPELDHWLSLVLAPHRISETITAMGRSQPPTGTDTATAQARSKIKECDVKLERHRAALEAGGHSATIARWIAETEAQKTAAETQLRQARKQRRPYLSQEEIAAVVQRVDDLRTAIPNADRVEKQKLYEQLGLKMTYCPEREEVRVEINFNPDSDSYRGVTGRVRGRIKPVLPNDPAACDPADFRSALGISPVCAAFEFARSKTASVPILLVSGPVVRLLSRLCLKLAVTGCRGVVPGRRSVLGRLWVSRL